MANLASFGEDLFSKEAMTDPYPYYKRIRDAGPVVHLDAHGIYAISRYADVRHALLAHDKLVSGKGIAAAELPPQFNIQNTIASDEPKHARYRKIVASPLMPRELVAVQEQVGIAADDLIDRLVSARSFDVMRDLARILPVSIVSSLVGLPEYGREKMLDWGAAAFDVMGVDNARAKAAFGELGGMMHYIKNQCGPHAVTPGSLAARIWQAVDEGTITPQEVGLLLSDIVGPSLDTTIHATGHLIHQLGTNPDQWRKLQDDPSLIDAAVEEAIRLESPIRMFARVAAEDLVIDGSELPAGARVLVMFASANRDERKWEDPDKFWIERPGLSGHLGFGHGRHVCAGIHLARLEIQALLAAILAKVESLEVGCPAYQTNNILRGFSSLPAKFEKRHQSRTAGVRHEPSPTPAATVGMIGAA